MPFILKLVNCEPSVCFIILSQHQHFYTPSVFMSFLSTLVDGPMTAAVRSAELALFQHLLMKDVSGV